jgi:hypothetical protein
MTRSLFCAASLLSVAALVGCARNDGQGRPSQASTTSATGANVVVGEADPFATNAAPAARGPVQPAPDDDRGDPARRLGSAMCERMLVCDRVGPGRSWSSVRQCASEGRDAARVDLERLGCENGIRTEKLHDCEAALRAESCSTNQLSTMDRVDECRALKLCAR